MSKKTKDTFFVGDKAAGGKQNAKMSAISMTGDGYGDLKSRNLDPVYAGTPPKVERDNIHKGYRVKM